MFHRFAVPALLAATLALLGTAAPGMARTKAGAHPAAGPAKPFYDSRDARRGKHRRAVAASARTTSARRSFVRRLGPQAVLQVDPDTGTPRVITRLDGALTGPSEDGPKDAALAYIRANATALGLTDADLDALRLADRYTTTDGLTVLRWTQATDGIPAFDNGLKVGVDRVGRVLTVSGSPVHGLDVQSNDPEITAREALAAVRNDVEDPGASRVEDGPDGARRHTEFADGSRASLTVFVTPGEDRLAWDVITEAQDGMYRAAVDATSGRVLYRANLTKSFTTSVYDNYPGASLGGTQNSRTLPDAWLTSATTLTGPNTHTYADLADNNTPAETSRAGFPYLFSNTFGGAGAFCTAQTLCSWNSSTNSSWSTNRNQNATQVFYYVNNFHDHLESGPIGFDETSGNFENADPVIAQSDDGADPTGAATLPNSSHINNADMSTPPDGQSPTMQMYLFSDGGDNDAVAPDPVFRDVNGGDSAAIIYHEYTHGLSHRLVVDAGGAGALNSSQAGAMGEAWSDWYAMDFLSRGGFIANTGDGDVDLGEYTDATPNSIRSQALDCPVGSSDPDCPGSTLNGATAGIGGYTYGDFAKIAPGAEVHADGEIWGETLWDLRQAFVDQQGSESAGSDIAEKLITDGMRLSPPEPSFLDMRNAILAGDTAATGGANHTIIWNIFKARGMGFFASTLDAADIAPIEDLLSGPPASGGPKGAVTGRVTDADSGLPRSSISVGFGGHASKPTFADYFAATTSSDGAFSLTNLPVGTYPQLYAAPTPGYDRQVATNVAVTDGGTTTQNFAVRRDWAAASGGAQISAFTGTDNTDFGCGPGGAIDQSQGTGWGADNAQFGGPTSSITVALPQPITVTSFAIDPGATCGDGASATLKNYTLETSPDGTTWTLAKDASTSGGFSPTDAGHMTTVVPTAGSAGVQFVRLSLLEPQDACPSPAPPSPATCSGRDFIDVSEFAVYGAPPNVLPSGTLSVPATATPGQTVTLSASSFSDPDSAITGYDWDFDGNGTTDASTSGATTTFAYPAAGTFAPKVSVNDFRGGAGTATASIAVAAPVVTPPADTTPAVTPPADTTPAVTPPADTTPAVTPKKPALTLPKQRANMALVRIVCQSACTGFATLRVSKALAKRLHLKSRTIGSAKFNLKAGTTIVRVKIKKTVLRKLRAKRIRSAKLPFSVRVSDASRLVGTLSRSPKIPISRR